MKKAILFILALAFPLMTNAQYAPAPDYTQTKEFKVADTMAKTGIGILIASGVGITTGNIICVVQETSTSTQTYKVEKAHLFPEVM